MDHPPGRAELQAAVEKASPRTIYLFAIDPETNSLEAFLTRLAGLVKYALRANQGKVNLQVLAAATAQREAAVRQGLAWLEARGTVKVLSVVNDEIELKENPGQGKWVHSGEGNITSIATSLKAILDETAAFRAYIKRQFLPLTFRANRKAHPPKNISRSPKPILGCSLWLQTGQ